MKGFDRILRNTGWNLAGNAIPLIVALFVFPLIISRLGIDRFGLLSIVWVLIGYFSLFDLGLGRAITKLIAEGDDSQNTDRAASIASTGMACLIALGFAGAICLGILLPVLDHWLMRLPVSLVREVQLSSYLVAACIPIVVATAGLRGILEGFQEFPLLNKIRIPGGVLLFLAPALASMISPRLDVAVLSLILVRALIFAAHVQPCRKSVRIERQLIDRRWIRPMLQFGGWLTVSSVVGPIIVYLDRFVLAATESPSLVGYYAAPFEMVSRLLLIAAAMSTAVFPVLVSRQRHEGHDAIHLERNAQRLIAILLAPFAIAGMVFAAPILSLWLGADFERNSTSALQLLLPGLVLNSLAQISVVSLYARGRAKSVALLHLVQLPIYTLLLIYLVEMHGVAGAAAAWSIRAGIDCIALHTLVRLERQR